MDTPPALPAALNPSALASSPSQKKRLLKVGGLFIIAVLIALISFYSGYKFTRSITITETAIPYMDQYLSIRMDIKGTLSSVEGTSLVLDNDGIKFRFNTAPEVTVLAGPAQTAVHKNNELPNKLKMNKPVTINIQLIDGQLKVTNIAYDFEITVPPVSPVTDVQPAATGSATIDLSKVHAPLGPKINQATSSGYSSEDR